MTSTRKKNIVFNLLFWLCYFLYEWLANAAVLNEYRRYLISACIYVPITFLATNFTIHVLIKKVFLKGRKAAFWILFFISAIEFALIRRAFSYYFIYPLFAPQAIWEMPYLFLPKVIIEGVNIYLIGAVYTMIYFMRDWYEQQRLTQELQKDKAEAQLELLKSQVHPHFIFNTLNNIYSLSLQNRSQTSDLIYRLSSLLSYMLYDSKKKIVPIRKELEYLQNYIELEKVRHCERLDISINEYSSVDNFQITPFLLLPLVENSFKHGVYNNTEDRWIRIDLSLHNDWLTVKIENSKSNNNTVPLERNGIGLENVKRRLEILYPGKHEFKILDEEQSFLTILRVKNWTDEHTMSYN